MEQRFFFRALLALSVLLAACSSPFSAQQSLPSSSALSRPHATALPLDVIYIVNYNGNDVAQYGFDPASKPMMKPVASNYKLPCTGPDSIAIVPAKKMVFVACYSGMVVPLAIDPKTYTLKKAPAKPVAVPSPLYVLAPATGAANQLYVAEYGTTSGSSSTGAVAQLEYGVTSLKIAKTFTGGYYPGKMAFYTSPGGSSELLVSSPYENNTACTASQGVIDVYKQTRAGGLVAQTPIPVCSFIHNITVANGNVYWAGPSTFGGFSLVTGMPLASPAPPPWPSGQGPSYYTGAMDVVGSQKIATGIASHGGANTDFQVGANNGSITIFDGDLKPLYTFTGVKAATKGSTCKDFDTGITVGGKLYRAVCWQLINDNIVVYGLTKPYGRFVEFGKFDPGDFPYDFAFMPW